MFSQTDKQAAFDPKLYWENGLENDFSLHGVGYYGLGKRYNQWLYQVRRHVFLRIMRGLKLDLASAKVLDVGSGTGFYLDCWRELDVASVTASDLTDVSVQRLKVTYPAVDVLQLDVGELRLEISQQSFDIVSAFDILFHITDDNRYRQAIANVYGWLKPGGLFVFSDNFVRHTTERGKHEVDRSLDVVERIVQEIGFNIVARKPVFALMNYPIDTKRAAGRWLWRAMVAPIKLFPPLGTVIGAVLFPIDLLLTRIISEGPSTEIMICKKPHAGQVC